MHTQLSQQEKDICNTLVKEYNDDYVKHKVLTWWNNKFPNNQVTYNPNIKGIDLIGVQNPNFMIEVELSKSWKRFERPSQWTVRIPARKLRYWLPLQSEAIFIQTNHDATSCVLLTTDVIRHKSYSRILQTSVGYKEHFAEYYTWEWHDIR
jgi:hypothetical protein